MAEISFINKAKVAAKRASDGLRPLTSRAAETAGDLASATGRKFSESGVKDRVSAMTDGVYKKYEDSGAKQKVTTVTGKVSEQFDVASGQAMLKAVQDRLAMQDQYNDALANKLLEALDRIRILEEKLGYHL